MYYYLIYYKTAKQFMDKVEDSKLLAWQPRYIVFVPKRKEQ